MSEHLSYIITQVQLSSYHGTFILTARTVFERYLAQAVILAGTFCMLSVQLRLTVLQTSCIFPHFWWVKWEEDENVFALSSWLSMLQRAMLKCWQTAYIKGNCQLSSCLYNKCLSHPKQPWQTIVNPPHEDSTQIHLWDDFSQSVPSWVLKVQQRLEKL